MHDLPQPPCDHSSPDPMICTHTLRLRHEPVRPGSRARAAAVALTLLTAACSQPPSGADHAAAEAAGLPTVAVSALPGYRPSTAEGADERKVLQVPERAVAREGAQAVAYVVDYRGEISRRPLTLAPAAGDGAVRVLGGLHHGEQVALDAAAAAAVYQRQRQPGQR